MSAGEQCSVAVEKERWEPLSLTHVEYPPDDLAGKVLAYLSLVPVFILFGFVTLIVFKRELHSISFLCGLVLNEILNWVIKNVIKEPRPCQGAHRNLFTEYGMPSSHSQFIWFFSIYSLLFLYLRVYLMYHSWSQVIYGVIAGGVMGATWFIFTQEILTPLFPRIASWPISEFFLIRDTSLIPNILWFEYTVTRSEARNRQRKLGTKMQ
ncbi:dolichyldiphosphatase 1 isoform X2 [Amblyraja radiata]|uniref:dolichyldiphosphatase 1 isoform X2 n=1 Tax=Amblyraja radiata TaxID=386614 RepID=UPI001401C294|nr:dolichyldiphosphatase 1 isoform X2 [Amblyraja radiata]